ncbi:MAG TPA: hypothetical protein VI636_19790 [Candidatus Angelobacter sp.]
MLQGKKHSGGAPRKRPSLDDNVKGEADSRAEPAASGAEGLLQEKNTLAVCRVAAQNNGADDRT